MLLQVLLVALTALLALPAVVLLAQVIAARIAAPASTMQAPAQAPRCA